MSEEKFCIACEAALPGGQGIGTVCVKCYQKAKARPVQVVKKTVPAQLVLIFPLPCKHSENCWCWQKPPRWAVLHINACRQAVYIGGPFVRYSQAKAEAHRIRRRIRQEREEREKHFKERDRDES